MRYYLQGGLATLLLVAGVFMAIEGVSIFIGNVQAAVRPPVTAGKIVDQLQFQMNDKTISQTVVKYDFGITCVAASLNSSMPPISISCLATPTSKQ